MLDRFAREYRKRGVSVLGINVQDNSDDALAFVRDYDVRYPQLRSIGDERSAAFGSTGVPENFLVNPHGTPGADLARAGRSELPRAAGRADRRRNAMSRRAAFGDRRGNAPLALLALGLAVTIPLPPSPRRHRRTSTTSKPK